MENVKTSSLPKLILGAIPTKILLWHSFFFFPQNNVKIKETVQNSKGILTERVNSVLDGAAFCGSDGKGVAGVG